MKKIAGFLIVCAVLVLSTTTMSSCSRKTGCPVNETVHSKTDKNGAYSTKKGKSNLFPKDMRKKKKKN